MAGNGTVHAGLHISASQIRTYLRCGRLYELRYVRGVAPAFKPTAFAFGSAFHAALAQFYVALKEDGRAPSLECVTYAFRDAWERELEEDIPLQADDEEPGDKGQLVDKGVAMLGLFHEHASKSMAGVEVEAVEKPFSVDIYDPETGEVQDERLIGAFDLVVNDGRRRTVVESKTSARKYGEDQIRWDLQPTCYSHAAKRMGLGDVGVRYQILTKGKSPAIQVVDLDRTEEDELEFLRVTLGVMGGVDAGVFIPQRGWACGGCQFAYACRPPRPRAAAHG
jgi:CRISPR/Cas system-associated exonuclease Cas4 (RecB family)